MNGHPVDCVDKKGWSPLLYAHFQNHQDCVLALMEAKTEQVSERHGYCYIMDQCLVSGRAGTSIFCSHCLACF